ncbi:MAG: hypothetical protein V3R24_03845 [Gemmatimonadales bacterium]
MTNALLVPIRVPELGPSLGKMVSAEVRSGGRIAFDGLRLRIVTKLFESAGDARRLAAAGERRAAVSALGRETWLNVWDQAVSDVVDAVVQHVSHDIETAANEARMPQRRRGELALSDYDKHVLKSRLGSTGASLVGAVNDLDEAVGIVENATVDQRDALERWQRAVVQCARRLAESWERLEEMTSAELVHWRELASKVSRWRRSVTPVVIVVVVGEAVAIWLGLVLGGYLEAPAWFSALWQLVFG